LARIITRRRFFAGLGAFVVGGGGYAYAIEPHRVTTVERDLDIAFLPSDLDGKKFVQISDLHLGPTGADYLIDCFRDVEALSPEFIVVTGDWMTSRNIEVVDAVGGLMRYLKQPPLGVFGTFGNHDYGPTWRDKRIADALEVALTDAGVRVLRNQLVDVAGLQLIGLDELWAFQFDPEKGLATRDPKRAALVLSHNPDTLDQKGWGDYQGWVLSGHTHGGQCKAPFFRPPFVPVKNPRYIAGVVELEDGRRVYINRGLGYNRRVRFNARPEITCFTMRRA